MGILNLNFLRKSNFVSNNPIENILHKYGQDLCEYAKGYFSYVVTVGGPLLDNPNTFSLYILVPEVGYNYQILHLNVKDVETISVAYFTLKTGQSEIDDVKINQLTGEYRSLDDLVKKRLESPLANTIYGFLTGQVDMKRENRNVEEDEDDVDIKPL